MRISDWSSDVCSSDLWRTIGQHDFRMDDAGLVREIMVAPESVIVQSFRRTIGRARNGTRSVGAADDLGREMVDRHNSPYTAFLSARRQRRISAQDRKSTRLNSSH